VNYILSRYFRAVSDLAHTSSLPPALVFPIHLPSTPCSVHPTQHLTAVPLLHTTLTIRIRIIYNILFKSLRWLALYLSDSVHIMEDFVVIPGKFLRRLEASATRKA